MSPLTVVVLLVAVLLGASSSLATGLISISGTGTVRAAPDIATVTLGVHHEAKTAREALSQNNLGMELVIEELKSLGVDRKDLQTSNFNLNIMYSHNRDGTSEKTGYRASNDLTIHIRDLKSMGSVLDKAVTFGVNHVGQVRFSNSNLKILLQEARREAVRDAIAKASDIVTELGAELGSIETITEDTNVAPMGIQMQESAPRVVRSMLSERVPLEVGESSHSITIQASWQIVQGQPTTTTQC